jgi:amino acid transporter
LPILGYFWPAAEAGVPRAAIITGLVVVLTVINLLGVKQSARTSDVLTITKLIPLLLFIVIGLFFINASQFTLTAAPTFGSFTSAVFVLVYVFSGFEAVLINSGEVQQPQSAITVFINCGIDCSSCPVPINSNCLHWCIARLSKLAAATG